MRSRARSPQLLIPAAQHVSRESPLATNEPLALICERLEREEEARTRDDYDLPSVKKNKSKVGQSLTLDELDNSAPGLFLGTREEVDEFGDEGMVAATTQTGLYDECTTGHDSDDMEAGQVLNSHEADLSDLLSHISL